MSEDQLEHFVLELIQPGTTPNPWRSFLETYGQGVFHFCIRINDDLIQKLLNGAILSLDELR